MYDGGGGGVDVLLLLLVVTIWYCWTTSLIFARIDLNITEQTLNRAFCELVKIKRIEVKVIPLKVNLKVLLLPNYEWKGQF